MSTTNSSSPAAAQDHGTGQPVQLRSAARNPAQHQLRNMTWIPGGMFWAVGRSIRGAPGAPGQR